MASVAEHYEHLLAEHYSWLFGGFGTKVAENREFFKAHSITPRNGSVAVDLGPGPGFQSIPLAQSGFSVIAIGLNEKLLNELQLNSKGLSIKTVQDDLTKFASHCTIDIELCVCMGDTLTHLNSKGLVVKLFKDIHGALEEEGKVVLTYRDLTNELTDLERFMQVKSDQHTIFTCFLEYETDTVKVHDLIYEHSNNGWTFKKSSYRKLRLSPEWVISELENTGYKVSFSNVERGFVAIIADKN